MLPKSCEQISQEGIVVERPLADCGLSKVLLVGEKPCHHLRRPNPHPPERSPNSRQRWRMII